MTSATETPMATIVQTRVLVEVPPIEEVLARQGKSMTLPTATFEARSAGDGNEPAATCQFDELYLENIRNILFDSNERQYSFEGDYRYSYEHSSYNRSSTRTERTTYRVVVRRESRWSDAGFVAFLMVVY